MKNFNFVWCKGTFCSKESEEYVTVVTGHGTFHYTVEQARKQGLIR